MRFHLYRLWFTTRLVFVTLAVTLAMPTLVSGQQPDAPAAGQLSPAASESELGPRLEALPSPIVNGVLDHGTPSVGLFLNGGGICTGTLIGCRTFLTAAHCLCTEGGTTLTGAQCQNRPDLLNPTNKAVFFQHAPPAAVSGVTVHPGYVFGEGNDLALLRLAQPVAGIRPSRINQTGRPAFGSGGAIVGFGDTFGGAGDAGLKRVGLIESAPCLFVPNSTHVCWDFVAPIGEPGFDSSTCQGDSGGPLFTDFGSGLRVIGVTSGGIPDCLAPNSPWSADVFVGRNWIQSVAGADLHRSDCGSLPFAGEPGASILAGSGTLSAGNPDVRFNFEVPPGIGLLGLTLNGSLSEVDADLYLRRGSPPTTSTSDCASQTEFPLEVCGISNPQPGTWHILARRFSGSGPFQVTVTLFEAAGGNGDPPPPAGPWLSSSALPGFEAKVLINGTTLGSQEADCIAETLCVSGALAGRPEVFVKVIGPRPNGFLWSQLSRFTPSKLEIWLRQTSTGQINYYELAAVGANEDNVSGLQDREAFTP